MRTTFTSVDEYIAAQPSAAQRLLARVPRRTTTTARGTIGFPLDAPVPARAIAAVAKYRAREVREMLETRTKRTVSRTPRRR